MFRVIVCGSRDFSDADHLNAVMDRVLAKHPDLVVVEGGARGADSLAGEWASNTGVPVEVHLADWDREGRSAGVIRNKRMLDSGVQAVVAFYRDNNEPSRGTAHMVRIAEQHGVCVYVPPMPAYQF